MRQDTNPDWAAGLHKQLGDDWQFAVVVLAHVLGARFASRFSTCEDIKQASEGFRTLFIREALRQRGFEEGPFDV